MQKEYKIWFKIVVELWPLYTLLSAISSVHLPLGFHFVPGKTVKPCQESEP